MKPIPNLISILLPVHNAEKTLYDTLGSLKAQTCRDYEVVLIDDASTDGTLSMAQSIATRDSRIHLIALPNERGIEAARTVGLDAARGQYLTFIGAEEAWDTTKLFKQREFMRNGNHGFTCTAYRTDKGRIHQLPQPLTLADLTMNQPIQLSTVMLDRNRVGDFRLESGVDQDLKLFNLLIQQGHPPVGLPEVLATCVHPSSSLGGFRLLRRRWHIATTIFRLRPFEAVKVLLHIK